jgi:hypothetical protein
MYACTSYEFTIVSTSRKSHTYQLHLYYQSLIVGYFFQRTSWKWVSSMGSIPIVFTNLFQDNLACCPREICLFSIDGIGKVPTPHYACKGEHFTSRNHDVWVCMSHIKTALIPFHPMSATQTKKPLRVSYRFQNKYLVHSKFTLLSLLCLICN